MKLLHSIVFLVALWGCVTLATAQDVAPNPDANSKAFEQATGELVGFNFIKSYQLFNDLLEKLPADHPLYFKAMLAKAISAQHITPPTQEKIDLANNYYQTITEQCPDDAVASRAGINLGRIAELRDYPGDAVDLPEARKQYLKVIKRWPDQSVADEATVWFAGAYIQVFKDKASVKQGILILEQWLARRPSNDFASVMWSYLAETYQFQMVNPRKALDCYLQADKLGLPVQSQASAFYWRMATIAQTLPDALETCIAYYQKIIKVTPTSGRAFEAQLALEKLSKAHPKMKIQVPEILLYQVGE